MKVLQLPLGMRTVIIALGANLHFYLDSHEIIRQSTAIINWTNPASQNLIFCNPQQYCIGESCELTCNQTHSRKIALNMKHDFISTVDVENSKDCIFYFPSDCEKCICVARTSPFRSQNVLKSCQPCQFKSVGWLQKTEMQKFAPEKAPIFFPTSCDIPNHGQGTRRHGDFSLSKWDMDPFFGRLAFAWGVFACCLVSVHKEQAYRDLLELDDHKLVWPKRWPNYSFYVLQYEIFGSRHEKR